MKIWTYTSSLDHLTLVRKSKFVMFLASRAQMCQIARLGRAPFTIRRLWAVAFADGRVESSANLMRRAHVNKTFPNAARIRKFFGRRFGRLEVRTSVGPRHIR